MRGLITGSLLVVFAAALTGQQPKVADTQFRVEAMGQNLAATVDRVRHSSDQLWLGYEIAALPGHHMSACSDGQNYSDGDDGCCGEYRLEDEFNKTHRDRNSLGGAQDLYVLLRFEKGELLRVRLVGAGCHLNAGGVNFAWLEGVKPEESIAYLAGMVNQNAETHRVMEGALLAISMHASPEATKALERIASSSESEHTREQAAFWLGVQRGHEGFVALKSLEEKGDAHFREKLAFDFSQNSDPAAEDELIHMAKFDAESKVREQALFWIAQKAGKRATAALNDAIQNDPETEVKKKAVFALSQLPKEEGVPQLIHVADTNTNPEVRKQAFFWLGQSGDPRALDYLAQVLKK